MTRQKQTIFDQPVMGPRIQLHLGEQLRQFYSSIASEPVPQRFLALLEEMEHRERSRRAETSQEGDT
ncbi:MAG: NepR family anti-sigma factor [Ancalomicrobiaceae bacterium]|nr:NepR family anti-sigma factor [Ancalomicrobiaceae bacterium]